MSEQVQVQPEVPVFTEILAAKSQAAGLKLTAAQLQQFGRYYELLILANNQFNLTALTSPEDVAVKHMVDSLLALDNSIRDGQTLIDVGTGAGFPGLALKIYRPGLKVTLLDSLTKRLTFLESVIKDLGLREVRCVHARAEDAGHDAELRGRFDIVTARAVARLAVLAEYTLPLAKVQGLVIALKGSAYQEELEEAQGALKILGGKVLSADRVELPGLDDGRAIIKIKKTGATPKQFPRKAGLPAKKPLV
jgi:16S rRNA (guanine527-N7)-methyltransferase